MLKRTSVFHILGSRYATCLMMKPKPNFRRNLFEGHEFLRVGGNRNLFFFKSQDQSVHSSQQHTDGTLQRKLGLLGSFTGWLSSLESHGI